MYGQISHLQLFVEIATPVSQGYNAYVRTPNAFENRNRKIQEKQKALTLGRNVKALTSTLVINMEAKLGGIWRSVDYGCISIA